MTQDRQTVLDVRRTAQNAVDKAWAKVEAQQAKVVALRQQLQKAEELAEDLWTIAVRQQDYRDALIQTSGETFDATELQTGIAKERG